MGGFICILTCHLGCAGDWDGGGSGSSCGDGTLGGLSSQLSFGRGWSGERRCEPQPNSHFASAVTFRFNLCLPMERQRRGWSLFKHSGLLFSLPVSGLTVSSSRESSDKAEQYRGDKGAMDTQHRCLLRVPEHRWKGGWQPLLSMQSGPTELCCV